MGTAKNKKTNQYTVEHKGEVWCLFTVEDDFPTLSAVYLSKKKAIEEAVEYLLSIDEWEEFYQEFKAQGFDFECSKYYDKNHNVLNFHDFTKAAITDDVGSASDDYVYIERHEVI
jgi:hypothetical protein